MDSREVNVIRLVSNVEVKLVAYPNKVFMMDIIVIACPAKWGMLLSIKWKTTIGRII